MEVQANREKILPNMAEIQANRKQVLPNMEEIQEYRAEIQANSGTNSAELGRNSIARGGKSSETVEKYKQIGVNLFTHYSGEIGKQCTKEK